MGREVRRVPKDWDHPCDEVGGFIPMFDDDFESASDEWKRGYEQWKTNPKRNDCEYWEYEGNPPERERFHPKWTDEERTNFQMYETTTEGTPISPVMETPEELAQWLVDNSASAFAGQTASYEAWLRVARGGFACSAVLTEKGLESAVEALTRIEEA